MTSAIKSYSEVHRFWFGDDWREDPLQNRAIWWGRPDGIDDLIRDRFLGTVEEARAHRLDHWSDSPSGMLALILVLDQFPRHVYRGTPAAFSHDGSALGICLRGLELKWEEKLHWVERQFFLLPLEHAEDLSTQQRSVREFERLVEATPFEFKDYTKDNLEFAIRHLEIIERFGRFPHRNKILGRESTDEELEFLKTPGSSF